MEEDRSGLELRDEGSRLFRDEVVDGRRSAIGNLLDINKSSLEDLENKEGPSKVVNSFFET